MNNSSITLNFDYSHSDRQLDAQLSIKAIGTFADKAAFEAWVLQQLLELHYALESDPEAFDDCFDKN